MADVKAGAYKPTAQAVVAAGGALQPLMDSTTNKPVQVIIDPTNKLIS